MQYPEQPSLPDSDSPTSLEARDPHFQATVRRLHRLTVYGRWLTVLGLWLTVGALSLWGLRYPISLLQDYFTWAAVRYGLAYHPIPGIGLGICVGMTGSVLVWQSRNVLVGLPKAEQQRLEKLVYRIQQQGPSHPLWNLLYGRKR